MYSERSFTHPQRSAQRFDLNKLTQPQKELGRVLPNEEKRDAGVKLPDTEQNSQQQKTLPEISHVNHKEGVDLADSDPWKVRRTDAITGTPEFMSSGILQDSLKAHQEITEEDKRKQEKKEILNLLNSNDLEKVTDFIINEAGSNQAFQLEMQRVKKEYEKELASVDFLTEKDWKIFTAMELYHKETFLHQIRSMLELLDCLKVGSPRLAEEITNEDVSINQLAIGTGLHDLGKLGIPKFILDFKVKDEEWTFHFTNLPTEQKKRILAEKFPDLEFSEELLKSHDKLHEFFQANNFYAVSVVPIEAVISKEQKEILEARNIDSSLPLMKIMQPHEKYSEIYLKKLGYGLEALIAGNHHGNNTEESEINKYPISQTTIKFIVELLADIVHFFDVKDALTSHRGYMNEKTFTEALALTISQKYKKPHAAAILANYQMQKFLNDKSNLKEILTNPERVQKINEFIEKYLPDKEKLYYDNSK